jgi:hypothetical protein
VGVYSYAHVGGHAFVSVDGMDKLTHTNTRVDTLTGNMVVF